MQSVFFMYTKGFLRRKKSYNQFSGIRDVFFLQRRTFDFTKALDYSLQSFLHIHILHGCCQKCALPIVSENKQIYDLERPFFNIRLLIMLIIRYLQFSILQLGQ